MIRPLALAAMAMFAVAAGSLPFGSSARAEANIVSATISNEYPQRLVFKLEANATSDITDITLAYAITGRGTSALGKPEFTTGKSITTQVVIQVNSGAGFIPVGSEFVYHWEVTTADGQITSSPQTRFLYLPPNQTWLTLSNDFMTVHYYGAVREALATSYLKAGEDTYQRVGKTLLGITLGQVPVRVVMFANEAELDPARPGGGSGGFDAAVVTCGTKVTIDIVLVIPTSCGTRDKTDTLRHEFGHILNQTAGEGPLGKLPSWLDEGTAVYAQSEPGDNYVDAFESAARANRLIPFAQMGTPSNDANLVNLFYGQSYAMALYLIEKGGPAKYAAFFATIKRGTRFDDALRQTYGFDLAGFETEFREALSLAQRVTPTAVPTQRQQQQRATNTPRATTASAQSTNTGNDDSGGVSVALVAGLGGAMVLLLLASLAFLASQVMANNRRKAAAAAPSLETPQPTDWQPPPGPD